MECEIALKRAFGKRFPKQADFQQDLFVLLGNFARGFQPSLDFEDAALAALLHRSF